MSEPDELIQLRSELHSLSARERRAILNGLSASERRRALRLLDGEDSMQAASPAPGGDPLGCFSPWVACMIRDLRAKPPRSGGKAPTPATRDALLGFADSAAKDPSGMPDGGQSPFGGRSLTEIVISLVTGKR